jgi:hypothetical protein
MTMLQTTQRQLDRFLRYPARKVIGVADTPAELERTLELLEQAGFSRDAIMIFSGDEGIRCVDPRGVHHGLIGRLTRVVQALGDEREHLERYEEELRAGHFLVVAGRRLEGASAGGV